MGDQPGAGRGHSHKIKRLSRPRRAAKPYSRPSDRKKGYLESVKDFFSPSWLVDFWKGKKVSEEDEFEDFVNEDEGDEPVQATQGYEGPSRGFDRVGPSIFEGISGTSGSSRAVGNGGVGIVASAQTRTQTSQKSGLSSLFDIKPRDSLIRKALETRTTGFASSVSESTRSNHDDDSEMPSTSTSTHIDTTETRIDPLERESLNQDVQQVSTILTSSHSELGPSPILFNPGSRKTTPSLFTTTLLPGSSSTPLSSQNTSTPGPSLLSSERMPSTSSSRPQPTSVFRSRPEFSVSAFGSSLPPRPSSQTGRFSSPYYSGKTIFGGAASHTSKRARISSPSSVEPVKPIKRQIKPTPIAGPSGRGMASQTAKRILETLEKMSSPLVDAKKIPPSPPFSTSTSPLSFTQTRRRKTPQLPYNKPIGSPRKLEAKFGGPPVQSLSVPQRAAISRIYPKTDSTTSTSQMTSTFTGQTSTTITSKPIQSFTPIPLPVSLSPMETSKGGGGKIRSAKTSTHYKSVEEDEEVTNPLPQIISAVPLKLPTGTSLPSFSFPTSLPSKTTTKTTSNKAEFAFATSKSNAPDISSNNFKFSVPEPKIFTSNVTSTNMSSPPKKIEYSFSNPAPVNKSETTTSTTTSSKVQTLQTNSLDKFKPSEGSWECSACLINNKASTTSCIACATAKPCSKQPPLQSSNDLFKQFQPLSGSWSCGTCLLNNKGTDQKCIACQTPRPSLSQKANKMPSLPTGGMLKQFAPPTDSWECPMCMLNNKGQDLKCVACQEPKPGAKPSGASKNTVDSNSLSKQFAPDEGSWTCDTCMVVNKSSSVKCLACESPKPGSGGFTLSAGNKFTNSPFKFGAESSSEDTNQKTIKSGAPSDSTSDSNPFKFGPSTSSAPIVFGAPSNASGSEKTFHFGSSATASSLKPDQFGSPATSDSSSSTTYRFGASEGSSTQLKPSFHFGKGTDSKTSESATGAATTVKFGSTVVPIEKTVSFAFGGSNSPLKNCGPVTSTVEKEAPSKITAPSQASPKAGHPSIAQAAAAGLLKIPVNVVDLTSGDSNSEPPKPQDKDVAPPNVNLFASQNVPSSSQMFSAVTAAAKPEPSTTTTLPSLPFAFGASTPATKVTEDPPKATPAFPFAPIASSATTLPKFGQTPAPSTTTPVQGFNFGADKTSATSTVSGSAPQLGFSSAPQQGNVIAGFSDAAKNTATTISSSPFIFKGIPNPSEKFASTSSTVNASSGFGFGGAAPSGNGGFAFGGGTASQPGSSTGGTPAPFVFGAQTGATHKSGFPFGASTQQPFAFGSGSANPTPQVSIPQTVSEESMDADGNNNNSQPAAPTFGSSVAATSSTPFNFPAAPANTGFNFSGAQQPSSFKFGETGATGSTPPVFGGTGGLGSTATPAFGANTGNPLQQGASAGFNFGSPATNSISSQPGGFALGAGSAGAFNAGAGPAAKRVIKRGIRRSRK